MNLTQIFFRRNKLDSQSSLFLLILHRFGFDDVLSFCHRQCLIFLPTIGSNLIIVGEGSSYFQTYTILTGGFYIEFSSFLGRGMLLSTYLSEFLKGNTTAIVFNDDTQCGLIKVDIDLICLRILAHTFIQGIIKDFLEEMKCGFGSTVGDVHTNELSDLVILILVVYILIIFDYILLYFRFHKVYLHIDLFLMETNILLYTPYECTDIKMIYRLIFDHVNEKKKCGIRHRRIPQIP